VVDTVILAVPDVVTDVGEKLTEVPVGTPLTLNVTAPVKPFSAVTVIEYAALLPRLTDFDVGDAVSVNEGGTK
jgi:hypothetical protein